MNWYQISSNWITSSMECSYHPRSPKIPMAEAQHERPRRDLFLRGHRGGGQHHNVHEINGSQNLVGGFKHFCIVMASILPWGFKVINVRKFRLNHRTRWWQLKYFWFSSLFGEEFQFDEHIFQMGWFNHQPVFVVSSFPGVSWSNLTNTYFSNGVWFGNCLAWL